MCGCAINHYLFLATPSPPLDLCLGVSIVGINLLIQDYCNGMVCAVNNSNIYIHNCTNLLIDILKIDNDTLILERKLQLYIV